MKARTAMEAFKPRARLATMRFLWSLGLLNPALSHVRDTEALLGLGHSAFCDQASFLLLTLASGVGIPARHVGLNGHVVMEAWYENDWHLFDPDMEVVPVGRDGDVLGVELLARNTDVLRKAYSGPRSVVVPYIASREDNT